MESDFLYFSEQFWFKDEFSGRIRFKNFYCIFTQNALLPEENDMDYWERKDAFEDHHIKNDMECYLHSILDRLLYNFLGTIVFSGKCKKNLLEFISPKNYFILQSFGYKKHHLENI